MKFAFLAHPLSQEHRALLAVDDSGRLRRSWGGDIFQFCQLLHQNLNSATSKAENLTSAIRVVDEFRDLVSATGAKCAGRFYEIPMDAQQILQDPNRALRFMEQAVDDAAEWGAEIIGLGSMTGIVGGQGEFLAERGPVAITTGNSLTVFSAYQNLLRACLLSGIQLQDETVAIIGVPGSIAAALAKILAPQCKSLICVARTSSTRAVQLASSLNSQLSTNIAESLQSARVILSATSSGDCIDQNWLRPGSLVIDVAVPTDVIGNNLIRNDVLILTGGMLMTPASVSRESMFIGFNHGMIPSCFGETLLLALENRRECFSIGRSLSIEGILAIGSLAQEHGFDFSGMTCFGVPVDHQQLSRFKKAVYQTRMTRTKVSSYPPHFSLNGSGSNGQSVKPKPELCQADFSGNGHDETKTTSAEHHRNQSDFSSIDPQLAMDQHELYINPVLVALGKRSQFLKTFVRGEGCHLWDEAGRMYLDFVAGFGSVNLGHNHPAVVQAIQNTVTSAAPGFAPAAVNPYSAALADRLVSCAPENLDMVTFVNSGAEAIEAAIKLVRITSDRHKILYCHGSYHGKTLGALSITGNAKFQKPFEPLLDGMEAVEFGDAERLAEALRSRKFAAFVVEPIQCEGGMNVPPPGYLKEAEALCRDHGTLLVVDEIQTGLGRTGKMFCAEHAGVAPDIMTLAKSLGGGLIPCGAMLCRRDLWLKAYGSVSNFSLHSSTFSGGSLAMAAGLATLDVLAQGELLENCRARSAELLSGLRDVATQSDLIADVRGQGLLIGIEFHPLPNNISRHFAAHDPTGVSHFLAPQAIEAVRHLTPIYVMQTLLDEFGIYTQIARSRPSVLRVQPPLSISAQQVQLFLQAMERICDEFSFSNRITDSMIAKSTLGNLDKKKTQPQPQHLER